MAENQGLTSRVYNFFGSKFSSVIQRLKGRQKVSKAELEVILSRLTEDFNSAISSSQKYISNALEKHYNDFSKQYFERTEKLQKIVDEYIAIVKDIQEKAGSIEKYNSRIAGIELQLREIKQNPLGLFGKDNFFQEIAASSIKKIEDKAREVTAKVSEEATKSAEDYMGKVDDAIKARFPDIDQMVADAINKVDGAQPGTLESTIKRKIARKHQIRTRNRILGGIAAVALFGTLVFTGWSAYSNNENAKAQIESYKKELDKYKELDMKYEELLKRIEKTD